MAYRNEGISIGNNGTNDNAYGAILPTVPLRSSSLQGSKSQEIVLPNERRPTGTAWQGQEVVEGATSKRRKFAKKFCGFLFSHIGLTILVFGYILAGAYIFQSIEDGRWLDAKLAELDVRRPAVLVEPDYTQYAATAVTVWRASWMDDKVLRFWNGTHQINEVYPDDWTKERVEQIHLWEVELNTFIINTVARIAAEVAANKTAREMEKSADVLNAPNWSFPSAFLYALSIITTIGYGHVAPYTNLGKIVTIAYAVCGIPILLAFLANIGNLLARCFRLVFEHFVLMKGCRRAYRRRAESIAASASNSPAPIRAPKPSLVPSTTGSASPYIKHGSVSSTDSPAAVRKPPAPLPRTPVQQRPQQYRDLKPTIVIQDSDKAPPRVRAESLSDSEQRFVGYTPEQVEILQDAEKAEKSVPVLMCVIIMGVYLFGGAVLFSVWEGWNYLEGLYFCFITLSTIGLGDMIPGASLLNLAGGKTQLIACCLYILIGLALLASCFNLIHDSARGGLKQLGTKLGIVKPKPSSRRASTATLV